jgi:hypothetical protein
VDRLREPPRADERLDARLDLGRLQGIPDELVHDVAEQTVRVGHAVARRDEQARQEDGVHGGLRRPHRRGHALERGPVGDAEIERAPFEDARSRVDRGDQQLVVGLERRTQQPLRLLAGGEDQEPAPARNAAACGARAAPAESC